MPKPFSHEHWVEGARAFVRTRTKTIPGFSGRVRTAKALPVATLAQMRKSLPLDLPNSVAEFLLSASSGLHFRYEWDVSGEPDERIENVGVNGNKMLGGTTICSASAMPKWLKDCRAWAEETWIADDSDEQALWLKCLPIASLQNGDFIAVKTERNDPPVVYLSHDNASRVISPSFMTFLKTWERLCYLGPEIWMLENFIDPKNGFLNADTVQAQALRRLFQVVEGGDSNGGQ